MFFIVLAVAASSALFAQQTKTGKREERRKKINAMIKEEEEGVIAYQRHTIFGLKLVNDGYGAFLEIGRAQSIKKALLFYNLSQDIPNLTLGCFCNRFDVADNNFFRFAQTKLSHLTFVLRTIFQLNVHFFRYHRDGLREGLRQG